MSGKKVVVCPKTYTFLSLPTPLTLPSTPPLVGVFTANSCTEKLRIHSNFIEVKTF